MQYAPELDGPDLLGWWLRQPNRRGRLRTRRPTAPDPVGLRFAFYGRMSWGLTCPRIKFPYLPVADVDVMLA
jgi:hypothetical protein